LKRKERDEVTKRSAQLAQAVSVVPAVSESPFSEHKEKLQAMIEENETWLEQHQKERVPISERKERGDNFSLQQAVDQHNHIYEITEKKLAKARTALRKIDDGTFGRCPVCGGEIDRERLEKNPDLEMCVSCASKAKGEKKPIFAC